MLVRITQKCDGPPVGTELEGPRTHYLCQLGIAEPIDEEAKAKHAEWLAMKARIRKQVAEKARAFNAERDEQQRAADQARLAEFETFLTQKD